MSDTYNMGPTTPALFKAHEERYQKLCEAYANLKAENEALRKDAERYRFIRKMAWFDWDAVVLPKDFAYSEHAENAGLPEMTDEAIDAAIKEQSNGY